MRLVNWFVAAFILMSAASATAQLNGENLLGDTGVGNGSQPAPGLYLGGFYVRYASDTLRNADGESLTVDPSRPAEQTVHAFAPLVVFVSTKKFLGANYGMMAAVPVANGALDAPALGFQADIATGLGDVYVVPVTLGWRQQRANFNAGIGFFAPTGRYADGADDNLGKGMWSWELSAGTTAFLDERKTWSVATSAFWETHTSKEDSETKVGQLLTLEGGVGKSFLQGAMSIGVAYYAQWKLTADRFDSPPTLPAGQILGKHRVFGFGPDVTMPIATSTKLIALLTIRYLWETAAKVKTEGQTLVMSATLPVPSIRIK